MSKDIITVLLHGSQLVVDSRLIAEDLGIKHESFIKTIKKHQISIAKLGKVGFEIRPLPSGQQEVFCFLNENQATFVMTLSRNTEKVVACKLHLVQAFTKAKNLLAQRAINHSDCNWQNARESGKRVRLEETAQIKAFVEYARSQGSKNAHNYYQDFTKMVIHQLFEGVGTVAQIRDWLNASQLVVLAIAEDTILGTIAQGIDAGTEYHEIFQTAKQRVIDLSEVTGKSLANNPQLSLFRNP